MTNPSFPCSVSDVSSISPKRLTSNTSTYVATDGERMAGDRSRRGRQKGVYERSFAFRSSRPYLRSASRFSHPTRRTECRKHHSSRSLLLLHFVRSRRRLNPVRLTQRREP